MKKKITKKAVSKPVKKSTEKIIDKSIKAANSKMSVELLSHFNCKSCNGWWSIGDAVLEDRADWFCPWCGLKNTFERFNNK